MVVLVGVGIPTRTPTDTTMNITESRYKEEIRRLIKLKKYADANREVDTHLQYQWIEQRQCTREEWSQIIEKFVNQPNSKQVENRTVRKQYKDIVKQGGIPYYLEASESLGYLITLEDGEYVRYRYNDDRNESLSEITGTEAWNYVDGLFVDQYGLTIQQAFGETVCKEYRQYIPELFVYSNEHVMKQILNDVSYNDINSAYPYAASQPLPDSRTRVKHFGENLPEASEEYPFAIYPKSKRIVIHNRVDSRNWKNCLQYRKHYDDHFDDTVVDDEVWLFKECQYSLKEAMNTLYAKKKEAKESGDEEALKTFKSYMVIFSGCMCPNPDKAKYGWNTKMLYLQRAFLIAYHIDTMCNEIKKIKEEGGYIIQVPTDAIICMKYHNGTPTKDFGGFDVEYSNGKFCGIGTNQYILEEPSGRYKLVQQGNVKPEHKIKATTAQEFLDWVTRDEDKFYEYHRYDIRTGKWVDASPKENNYFNGKRLGD